MGCRSGAVRHCGGMPGGQCELQQCMKANGMSAAACAVRDSLGEHADLSVRRWPLVHIQRPSKCPGQTVQENALAVCPVQGLAGVHRLEEAAVEQGREGANLAHSLIGHSWLALEPTEQAYSQPPAPCRLAYRSKHMAAGDSQYQTAWPLLRAVEHCNLSEESLAAGRHGAFLSGEVRPAGGAAIAKTRPRTHLV